MKNLAATRCDTSQHNGKCCLNSIIGYGNVSGPTLEVVNFSTVGRDYSELSFLVGEILLLENYPRSVGWKNEQVWHHQVPCNVSIR